MTSAIIGLALFSTVGPETAFFPTVFLACFAIGLGIGTAFMPLLTIAMADVPAGDAGLASGITNVSQQISGAVGLAVLSTVAANHTKGLIAAHLRNRDARPELQLAQTPDEADVSITHELESQAA
jgi:hypothetical protein